MIQAGFLLLLIGLSLGLPVAAVLAIVGYLLSENYAFIPMTGAAGELTWPSAMRQLQQQYCLPTKRVAAKIAPRHGMTLSARRWVSRFSNYLPACRVSLHVQTLAPVLISSSRVHPSERGSFTLKMSSEGLFQKITGIGTSQNFTAPPLAIKQH